MCGIAGVLRTRGDASPDGRLIDRMLDGIAHRGPDGRGRMVEGPVGLGHVRLSILDLSDAAAQPMCSSTGRSVITYNGEVYNYRELWRRLGAPELVSTGDTAVVVEYIERFGVRRFVQDAEGFFALGVWDRSAGTLTLARDRHGIKPLYFCQDATDFRFASEMWPLTEGRSVDPIAVTAMLAGRSLTTEWRTLYQGLRSVGAGEIIVVDAATGALDVTRPIRPSGFHDNDLALRLAGADDDELLAQFESALRKSIRLRMTSDAPVACLVSGGIDSSLVAALARDEGFSLPLYHADVVASSERPAAEMLARHLGADLIVEQATDDAIVESLVAVTRANEMPLSYHVNAIPFYLVSRKVSADGVKVILTGEGADEYLLGYPQYGAEWATDLLERMRAPLRRAVRARTASFADRVWFDPQGSMAVTIVDLISGMDRHRLDDLGLDVAGLRSADAKSVRKALALVNYHLISTLHRNDRLGMAWGLECRFPFLGHDVATVCLNGPARIRLRRTKSIGDRRHPFVVDKWLVRELARRWLPRDLVERPKLGFPVTIWDRRSVRMESLDDGYLASMFGFGRDELAALSESASPLMKFRCLLTEVWFRVNVERMPQSEVESFLGRALVSTSGAR
ncbi:MAG: asparagine synthase (glutamine-hydrolyzing) [Actinomycetota bacterium]